MKIIIAGSRDIIWPFHIQAAVSKSPFEITEVVSGTARGVDQLGEEWALRNCIPIKRFPADWYTLGKKAGILRNIEMANYADALIAIWDGESKGTKHMIEYMQKLSKPVSIYKVNIST